MTSHHGMQRSCNLVTFQPKEGCSHLEAKRGKNTCEDTEKGKSSVAAGGNKHGRKQYKDITHTKKKKP